MKSDKFSFHPRAVLIILVFFLITLSGSVALAATVGPNDPAVGANLTGIGTQPWQNPENIAGPGYASVVLYHGYIYSNYLEGTQYGFNIPADATITGIEVSISHMAFGPGPSIYDNVVSLVISDTLVGENKASPLSWPYSFTTATYGSPTDLWGTTITPAQVNLPGFGAVLAVRRGNSGQTEKYADVDTMQITIHYTYSTTTTVDCPAAVAYGDTITCTATITRLGSELTPTGTVDWATSGFGSFTPNPCELSGTGESASCQTDYLATLVGSGSAVITGTYSGDEYFDSSGATDLVTVVPRPITVSADALSKVYGQPDPALTYQITAGSLVFSDTFTGALTRDPGETVGIYPINQGTLALNDNYDLTYVGADLTIEPIAITVTADPVTKTYGQVDPPLTYTVTSGTLLPGDYFTGTLTRQPGEDAGVYPIELGTLALPEYYAITFVGADFTIAKADATCVVTPYNVIYDRLTHTATGACTGVTGEALDGLDLTGTTHTAPGNYIDTWLFINVTGNYNDQSGSVNDVISGGVSWLPVIFK